MKAISVVFHPLLLPTLMFFVIFRFVPQAFMPLSDEAAPYILLALSTTTFIIPVLSMLALRLTGTIKSLELDGRADRIVPFIFIAVFYGVTTYMFYTKISLNPVLVYLLLITTLLIVLVTVITFFWKISIHSAGMGGVAGFLLALVQLFPGSPLLGPFIVALLLLGWVMTARLVLDSHNFTQVLAGALLGFVFCYGMLLLLA